MGNKASALEEAAKSNPDLLRTLLAAGGDDPNKANDWGWLPLHYAAQGDQAESVRLLVTLPGARVNAISCYSAFYTGYLTPLQVAARERSLNALRALIAAPGIEVNHMSGGHTALHWASDKVSGGDRPELVQALLDAGANANLLVEGGGGSDTPRSAAALAAKAGYDRSLAVLLPRSQPSIVQDVVVRAARTAAEAGGSPASVVRHPLLAVALGCRATTPAVVQGAASVLEAELEAARLAASAADSEARSLDSAAGWQRRGSKEHEAAVNEARTKRQEADRKAKTVASLALALAALRTGFLDHAASRGGGGAYSSAGGGSSSGGGSSGGGSGGGANGPPLPSWNSQVVSTGATLLTAALGAVVAAVAAGAAASSSSGGGSAAPAPAPAAARPAPAAAAASSAALAAAAPRAGGGAPSSSRPPAPPGGRMPAAPPPSAPPMDDDDDPVDCGRGSSSRGGYARSSSASAAAPAPGPAVAPAAPAPAPAPAAPAADADPDSDAAVGGSCPVCMDAPRDTAFAPCGHTLCAGCAARVRPNCPVCRRRVESSLRLY